jgi:HlyD family secretion protein
MAKRSKRRWIGAGILAFAILGIALGAARFGRSTTSIPTAMVSRGVFTRYIELRGACIALRSIAIRAPRQIGSQVRILKLAPNGSVVKPGQAVVQFDASTLLQTLHKDQVTLKQAQAAIGQAKAKALLTEQKDVTAVMKARYALEQAKLSASQQAILSKIQGEENELAVADAQQAWVQAEQQLKSDKADGAASVQEKVTPRDKAQFDVKQTEREIAALTVNAPIAGVITLIPNPPWRDNAPTFRPGDQVGSGTEVAELPDLSTLRMDARVSEVDRGELQPGQAVSVRVDAVPDRVFTGSIESISTLAQTDFSSGWPPERNFDLHAKLNQMDPRLRPGMSANLRIAVAKLPNSILIPAAAAFSAAGETVAYVVDGSKFSERAIQVSRPSHGKLEVISGLKPGEKVALSVPPAREVLGH